MKRKILVADLLCGAGGSSTGCIQAMLALGWSMDDIVLTCVNHWPVAIDTHQRNHPQARHHVQDIAVARPHMIVPEGYLDLLMASPTCTHHSNARGGKPTSDQQRSDPWHIITWLTELRVKRLIIENVWEFIKWGPVDPRTGKPIKSREGEYFRAWISTIMRLGFDPEWRKLNAADYGDATTRQRFILMARSDKKTVHWPMPTHQKRERLDGDLFGTAKPWRPAREIIDWSIKGRSIFNRSKALAPKTMARIYAGAQRNKWPEPYLVILRNHMAAKGIDQPLPTIAAKGMHIGLAEPFILSQASGGAGRSVSEPIPTATTGGNGSSHAMISPYYGSGSGETCTSSDDPLPTVTSKGRFGMVVPVTQSGGGARARDVSQPIPTLTTAKGGEFAIVMPVTHHDGSARARDATSEPLPTVTGANRGELAFIAAQFGERDGQAPRVHDIDNPAPTICATGRVNLVEGTENYDILFRMLEPHELAAAMGFNTAEVSYEFAGNKTEQIKQIGNAVSVSKMRACVTAMMADAAPKRRAEPAFLAAAE